MYYLRSRYYYPELQRFISPDEVFFDNEDEKALANRNLFAYCDNNPISRLDSEGDFWNIIIGAVVGAFVGAVVSIVAQVATGSRVDVGKVLVSAGAGAISGGFAASGIGLTGQVIANTIIGVSSEIADTYIDKGKPTIYDIGKAVFIGGVTGAITGRIGNRGVGTRHLTSSRKALITAVKRGKPLRKAIKYWNSQTLRESINVGRKAIKPIIKSNAPGLIKSLAYVK
jgi:RHS repeat-associated protein